MEQPRPAPGDCSVIAPPTYTVETGYTCQDGSFRVFVRGHLSPLVADEPYPEGTAVRIVDRTRAVKS